MDVPFPTQWQSDIAGGHTETGENLEDMYRITKYSELERIYKVLEYDSGIKSTALAFLAPCTNQLS